ncbi:MAG: DUF4349 domain-containing protein [Brevundimonas sp.]|uniref:DUF4349 domain-containing protein n=1 Tax=Brevundimonas sp. TaxID=1871086 RepID=UPI0027250C23|nr:DUF4349 domain-containing protein [Brevundimonas sp.]MDO9586372.1 DUF4349 domain-containing protein [Brevundimonas sp.]
MRTRLMTVGGLALSAATAGCGQPREVAHNDEAVQMELVAPREGASDAATAPAAAAPASSNAAPPAAAVQAASIAYVYRYGLELPADRAPALMSRHEQACVSAGPAVCQVIGSQSSRYGRDELTARLEIRATPAFLTAFRARLAGDAEAAGGRVAMAATDSEDLTRALVDTEARMRALSTLRDRLQQLLATRSAPLEQLLATERELARVQGELDAARSTLEVMRTRVATSRLIIDYRAQGQLAPDSAFRPVSDALDSALTVFMSVVGALILFLAGALPLLIVVVPLAWLALRWRRRIRAERLAAKRAREAEAGDLNV